MKNTLTLTNEFSATIGVVAGYSGEECLKEAEKLFDSLPSVWQDAAGQINKETGIYISATCLGSKALYSTEWGCPVGGEPTWTIEGSRNPQFCPDTEAWQSAVVRVVRLVKEHFNQSTVTINFREVSQLYLK